MVVVRELRAATHGAGPAGVATLGATVFEPAASSAGSSAVLWCLAGGGMSRRYFDLAVEGDDSYSMARYLASGGLTVVCVDHPSCGDSDHADDPYALRPDVVADADHAAMIDVATQLGIDSSRTFVGLGHSMGALITVFLQARHELFDALVLLGFGPDGLPVALAPEEQALADQRTGDDEEAWWRRISELVATRFGTALPRPGPTRAADSMLDEGLPAVVSDAIHEGRTSMLALCGLQSMIPGASRPELDAVTVPVYANVGEHDIAQPWENIAPSLPNSPSVTVEMLPNARHMHVAEPSRCEQWDAILRWVRRLPT